MSTTHNPTRAVLWMFGALLSFSAMAISIREMARGGLSIFEILTLRSGGPLLILSVLLLLRPDLRPLARPNNLRLTFLRNVVHYGSQFCWALALTMLPLATVFALEFTMPAWAALLAVWFLGERMTVSRASVVVLGLIGVLVIVRPGIASFHPAAALVLLSAVGYAVMMTATKKLTATQSTLGILFWMALIQFPVSLIGSDLSVFLDPKLYDLRHILPAIVVGIGGLTSHLCLSNAFRYGDAMVVVPLDFIRIPLIAVVGWAFYNEALDFWVLFGALVIIAGVIWNLRAERAALRQGSAR